VNIPPNLTGGPSRAVVTVSANYGDKRVLLGSETFRLKNIPEPVLSIGNIPPPNVTKSMLIGSNQIIYAQKPVGFDLPANYSVLSYKFITQGPEGNPIEITSQGKTLTQEMVNHIKRARKGQVVLITEIKAKCPDGDRKLQGYISYQIN
jgi:hypothetical protein